MKKTRFVLFAAVLLLIVGCQSPTQIADTAIPTQPIQSELVDTTQPPTPELSDTPTPLPTETSTPIPTETPTQEPPDIDIFATVTSAASDYQQRMSTMLPPLSACEPAPRALGWREYRLEEIGLTMQLPEDWSDEGYRTYKPNQSRMFKVSDYGTSNSSHHYAVEGITIHVWNEKELDLIPFIRELRAWAADKEGIAATIFSPLPHINSMVNGNPASIAFIPVYDFGEYAGNVYWSRFVTVTKIGDYVILLEYAPRNGYDPTETITTILSSLSIDGIEGGETQISKAVRCQMVINSCLNVCHFTKDEMLDDNIFRP